MGRHDREPLRQFQGSHILFESIRFSVKSFLFLGQSKFQMPSRREGLRRLGCFRGVGGLPLEDMTFHACDCLRHHPRDSKSLLGQQFGLGSEREVRGWAIAKTPPSCLARI